MKKLKVGFITLITALMFIPSVFAQEPFIYPDKGQSNEQMEKDKFECYSWAKGQTGFDPMQVPTATAPPPGQEAPQGSVVRDAGRGALTGVTAGTIADDYLLSSRRKGVEEINSSRSVPLFCAWQK